MPDQQQQVLEYYKKNPSAAASLRGSIYEEKIINLIREKSKREKKIISLLDADKLLKTEHEKHHIHDHRHPSASDKKDESKKPKKTVKYHHKNKKIRKK
jgi:trigger factor